MALSVRGKVMSTNNVVFILGLLFMVGWFGTSIYSTYANNKADIARIESNAEDFRRSITALGESNAAAAKASSEALARAIERLAERGQR